MQNKTSEFKIFWQIIDNSRRMVALTILSIIIILGLDYYNSFMVQKDIDDLLKISQINELTIQLQSNSLQARRFEKDFLLRKDPAIAQKYSAVTVSTMDTIEKMKSNPYFFNIAEPSLRMAQHLQNLYQHFDIVVNLTQKIGVDENSGFNKSLRDAAHNAEKLLSDNKLNDLSYAFLMMRRDEKDFIMRKDQGHLTQIVIKHQQFLKDLEAAQLSAELNEALATQVNNYINSFKELAAAELSLNQTIEKLSAIYGEFNIILEQALSVVTSFRNQEVTDIKSLLTMIHTITGAIAILLLILITLLTVNMLRLTRKLKKLIAQ